MLARLGRHGQDSYMENDDCDLKGTSFFTKSSKSDLKRHCKNCEDVLKTFDGAERKAAWVGKFPYIRIFPSFQFRKMFSVARPDVQAVGTVFAGNIMNQPASPARKN